MDNDTMRQRIGELLDNGVVADFVIIAETIDGETGELLLACWPNAGMSSWKQLGMMDFATAVIRGRIDGEGL